jgi:2-amino-4-hydroxy-6-hydroxymethyldihydropteridine diphosphokinase
VDFREWEPEYRRILVELGFDAAADDRSAALLDRLLNPLPRVLRGVGADRALRSRLRGRDVLIVGNGPGPVPLPLPSPQLGLGNWAVVAADGATSTCLRQRTLPAVIVSDLDGDVPDEILANRGGALMIAHAHGDNGPALRRWVPQLPGLVIGSCAGPPARGLLNVGGFTDGDRCLFLAEAFGARRAVLSGFDFEDLRAEPEPTRAMKRRKLQVAQRLIRQVSQRGKVPVSIVGRDGRVRPF